VIAQATAMTVGTVASSAPGAPRSPAPRSPRAGAAAPGSPGRRADVRLCVNAVSFGGVGDRGHGREMGFEAMHGYTDPKSVWVNVDADLPVWSAR
jgi:hypothetical protein